MKPVSIALEDQLRTTLARHASVTPSRPDEAGVRRHVRRRRRRRQVVPALGALAAITAGIVVSTRVADDNRATTAVAGDSGVVEPVGDLAAAGSTPMLVLPGWPTVRYAEIRYVGGTQVVVEPEYQFSSNGRNLQLHLYPGGRSIYDQRINGDARSAVTVFGTEASLLDYGNGRYRVDLLVGDVTFEFDGEPFASIDEFLATLEAVQVVDAATWEASLVGAERDVLETDAEAEARRRAAAVAEAEARRRAATAGLQDAPVSSSEGEALPPGK